MKRELVEETIECLGADRRVSYYFQDRYCFDLLSLISVKEGVRQLNIKTLRNSAIAHLLNKPALNPVLKDCGKGVIPVAELLHYFPEKQTPLVITFDRWGDGDKSWDQTSRNGCNLVLQINFAQNHVRECQQLIGADAMEYDFQFYAHPVNQQQRTTLAWVRLDIDYECNQVLIEEIQSDWISCADYKLQNLLKTRSNKRSLQSSDEKKEQLKEWTYLTETLKEYRSWWSEAALSMTLQFIQRDLGINHVYYHTYDTGRKLKRIFGFPPRSLYSQLPKRFGFTTISETPEMLRNNKNARRVLKKIENPQWFYFLV